MYICAIFLCFGLAFPRAACAATHWVSPTGTAAWGNCAASTALSGTAACSLATANANASAGDTVYLRGGTYNATLEPSNSGTCASSCLGETGASRIVFAAYTGETPVITGGSIGLNLNGNNWVKVTGITFQNISTYPAYLSGGASYNEISYNSFVNVAPSYATAWVVVGAGISGPPWSVHNWVHHNYISRAHNTDPCGEAIDLIRIGMAEQNPSSADNFNTLENNYMEYGGHSTLLTNSKYNVVRNNIAHNEPWIDGCTSTSTNNPIYDNTAYNGLYGHRNFAIGDSDQANKAFTLLEGNRLGFASTNPNNGGSSNIDLESPGNIVRYNFVYGGMDSGIYFKWANTQGNGSGGALNYVYNNTIYNNGKGWNAALYGHGNLAYNGQGIAQYTANGANTLNVVKNNIVYANGQGDICALSWGNPNCTAQSWDTVVNNWLTTSGDPKFTNPDLSNTLSQNLIPSAHGYTTGMAVPDFSLLSSSPAIDKGTNLTSSTNSSTGSTNLTVADASYFQDGSWGSDLARGVTFFPDWIAIGTVTNTVRISSVNYATNTITLASPMTWSNGAPIWLYKKSDGAVVLVGAAPDNGASEFTGTTSAKPAAPTNLRNVAQ